MRQHGMLVGVALIASTSCSSASQGPAPCTTYACQSAGIASARAVGQVTIGKAYALTGRVDGSMPPDDGSCSAGLLAVSANTTPQEPPPSLLDQTLLVVCNVKGRQLQFGFDLGDPRTATDSTPSLLFGSYDDPATPYGACYLDGSATARFTGVGSIAPFPALVTSDFRRTIEISGTAGPINCGTPFSITYQLTVDLASADFTGDSNGTCQTCYL